jgi:hypothetical protein
MNALKISSMELGYDSSIKIPWKLEASGRGDREQQGKVAPHQAQADRGDPGEQPVMIDPDDPALSLMST